MRKRLANLLLNLATKLGAERIQIKVIKDSYSDQTAAAVLTQPNWDEDHAAYFATFLKSHAGVALSNRLRVVAAKVAIDGAAERQHTIHAAGVSAGWNEAVRYLFSLSRVSRVEDTTKHAEQAPQDEASLLEQLSP